MRRATSAAAAAPNRRIIGGAGTGVPGGVFPLDPPLEEEDVLLLVLELVLLDVEVLFPPKLLDPLEPLEPLDPLLALEPLDPLLPELPLPPG
ncbi:MAG TPA: hypothetical protein VF628_13745 [Allosphingosinicella sp.]